MGTIRVASRGCDSRLQLSVGESGFARDCIDEVGVASVDEDERIAQMIGLGDRLSFERRARPVGRRLPSHAPGEGSRCALYFATAASRRPGRWSMQNSLWALARAGPDDPTCVAAQPEPGMPHVGIEQGGNPVKRALVSEAVRQMLLGIAMPKRV